MTVKPIITCRNLSKAYDEFYALHNVSFDINEGDIFGLIGLNGAGKTTLIRLLLGLIKPTEGRAYLFGEEVSRKHIHLWIDVGYLVETSHAYPELTVEENLKIQSRLRGITERQASERVIHLLNLTTYRKTKAKHLSLGNKQRLAIAKAILHRPKILLLDEPTNGLDPAGIAEVRKLLLQLAMEEGVTILISSHILDELAKLIQTVGIIHEGKLIKQASIAQLNEKLQKRVIVDTTNRPALEKYLTNHHKIYEKNKDGSISLLERSSIERPDKFAKSLIENDLALTKLLVEEETLEQYFLRIINEVIGKSCAP